MDVIREKLNTNLYKNQDYYLVLLGIGSAMLLMTGSFTLALTSIILIQVMIACAIFIMKQLNSTEPKPVTVESDVPDEIMMGISEKNKKPIHLSLETFNHSFIIGMTRYGKTRLVLALVAEFIEKFTEDEVLLAFSDAKAVSFNVFGRSKHLFAPIAKSEEETDALIELALTEMHRRLKIFSDYHEKICTNIDEYYELSGERLPRIVIIFDEVADSVQKDSKAERNLTTLAKMGLAAGIHLVLVTQRPTKLGITHEVTSQCQTVLCTYMKNPTEYGSVAKIPSAVYNYMRPEKGLFMAFNPDLAPRFINEYPDFEGWGFMRSRYVENDVIEGIAITDSTENLDLPDLEDSIPAWRGSHEDKIEAIKALEMKLGVVTIKDMETYFGVGRRTAKEWLNKYVND